MDVMVVKVMITAATSGPIDVDPEHDERGEIVGELVGRREGVDNVGDVV